MGSRVGSGVSPGESRARTGAAVGPGSISGLSRPAANLVINKAERLRGDNLNPETVRIASEFLGLPDRSSPGMKSFALPPSEAIKNIRPDAVDFFSKFQENLNQPPSMSVPQLPNTGVPGAESNNLPNTNPFELTEMPKINLPEAPPGTSFEELTRLAPGVFGVDVERSPLILGPPGTSLPGPGTSLEELTGFNPSDGSYPKKEVPPNAGGMSSDLAGILAILKQQGLL